MLNLSVTPSQYNWLTGTPVYHLNLGVVEQLRPAFLQHIDHSREAQQRQFFQTYLSPTSITDLDEDALYSLIHLLDSYRTWKNLSWAYQRMLRDGLDAVQDALYFLFYGEADLAHRFDYVRHTIPMMGSVAVAELLSIADPHTFAPYHDRIKQGLLALGIPLSQLPRSAQISGAQYIAFNRLITQLTRALPDTLAFPSQRTFAHFLAFAAVPTPSTAHDFEHETTIDHLLMLGSGLGFDTQREVTLAPGCRVDTFWQRRVNNLAQIAYAFEVQHKGSRDSAILNLQRAYRLPSIQRVVLVATSDEQTILRREIASLDPAFQKRVAYLTPADCEQAVLHLQHLRAILDPLGPLDFAALFR